ncbi:MAG: hypothetical protein A3H67_00525 [Candidatus Buchananbacteria bacterium RIFCSPLOWO2_02_FULL_46_11b]|uniref:ZIP family metal transporter n=1 Tax=Candidatus Buchananbacteria bacterium RIFCSPLOWO2_02_FULL_46_11b TaxID=1797548 RepID=A0A1G1YWQ9_9BACT|nr:MAG: hypothetical protein A3H67_00525 [Candidatus Buchananbacteria bacterium RIFCSPLOWO2_02_FULL_46_11b]
MGVFSLGLSDKILKKALLLLVSFSAGSLMGGAFFHLLPETLLLEESSIKIFVYLLSGFCLFFVLERVLRWRHCHEDGCETHGHLGWLNLFGDGLHNMIDGLVLISAFSISPALGWPVALSIVFHEIPQELGDFGVLLYSGFKKNTALVYNFLTALLAVAGVVAGYFLIDRVAGLNLFLLPFAAGGFIYIAASDLIPEIHQEKNKAQAFISFGVFLAALGIMLLLKLINV